MFDDQESSRNRLVVKRYYIRYYINRRRDERLIEEARHWVEHLHQLTSIVQSRQSGRPPTERMLRTIKAVFQRLGLAIPVIDSAEDMSIAIERARQTLASIPVKTLWPNR